MELKFSLSKPSVRSSLRTALKIKPSSPDVLSSVNVPFKDMWETYNHFRQKGIFCDVVLVVNGTKFPVHRAILAAHSSYFFALFTNGMKESMEDVITMEGLETDIIEVILDYIYTLKLPLNHDNIYGVFSHAECFCLIGICDICVDYLVTNLSPDNSIECLKFAKIYNRTDLVSKCESYILQNFIDVVHLSKDFLISIDQFELSSFLSNNLLNVNKEEQAFMAAIHWVNYDCAERACHLDKFLRCLRLGLLSSNFFLEEAFRNFHVSTNWNKVEEIADQAWSLINWSEKNGLMSASSRVSMAHPLLRPRIPRHVLFAIGGWSGDSAIAFIETYDSKVDHWYSHPLMEDMVPRAYHAMVVHDSLIYLIGGFDGSYYFNSVKSFDPEIGEWKELAPMYSQRCYVSGASRQGHIYACGGFDGRSRLNTVECYSVATNQWRYVQPMHHQRSDASADFLRDDLYIVGGFNGEHCLSSAECYNIISDQWTLIHRMSMARSGVSLIGYQGFLYGLGGFDGSRRLDSCERYNPVSNVWEAIGRMNSARSNFAVAAMDDVIYAIGGFDGSITISQSEGFVVEKGKWIHVADLNMNRSALKACVMDGLPNSYRFTFYGHQTEHGDAAREPPLVSVLGYKSVEEMFSGENEEKFGGERDEKNKGGDAGEKKEEKHEDEEEKAGGLVIGIVGDDDKEVVGLADCEVEVAMDFDMEREDNDDDDDGCGNDDNNDNNTNNNNNNININNNNNNNNNNNIEEYDDDDDDTVNVNIGSDDDDDNNDDDNDDESLTDLGLNQFSSIFDERTG